MTFGKLERRTFNFMSDTTNTRKYKGYELDQTTSHRRNQNRPWFWKVLGISLLLTVLILAGVVFGLLHRTHKNAKHMEEINSANTVEALLKEHKLLTLIWQKVLIIRQPARLRKIKRGTISLTLRKKVPMMITKK